MNRTINQDSKRLSGPLCTKSNWIESGLFRVVIKLNEPLQTESYQGSSNQRAVSYLILVCSKLEIILQTVTKSDQVNHLFSEMQDTIRKLDTSDDPVKYFEEFGLARLFPIVYSKMLNIPQKQTKGSPFEDYFNSVTILNQLVAMSSQLRNDVNILTNHKYLAHQIALLYQCLNQSGDAGLPYKKRVEQMFDSIKSQTEASKTPSLSIQQKQWLVTLTTDIMEDISKFTVFKQKMTPLLDYLKIKGNE